VITTVPLGEIVDYYCLNKLGRKVPRHDQKPEINRKRQNQCKKNRPGQTQFTNIEHRN